MKETLWPSWKGRSKYRCLSPLITLCLLIVSWTSCKAKSHFINLTSQTSQLSNTLQNHLVLTGSCGCHCPALWKNIGKRSKSKIRSKVSTEFVSLLPIKKIVKQAIIKAVIFIFVLPVNLVNHFKWYWFILGVWWLKQFM